MALFEAPNQEVEQCERLHNVKGLIELLQEGNVQTRREAAKALGELHAVQATEPLIQALKDQDLIVRYWAADGLGKIGGEQAIEPLIEALEYDNRDLVEAATRALKEIRIKNEQTSQTHPGIRDTTHRVR